MTVTIIVDGKVWFQDTGVEDLTIEEGLLCICIGEDDWKCIEIKRVEQVLATSY